MMNAKSCVAVLLVALASVAHAAVPVVTNVVAQQRASTKIVDINYDVFDADGDLLKIRIEVSNDGGIQYLVPAISLTGDIGDNIATGVSKHIVWDAGQDWDGEYSDQMRVKVIAVDGKGFPGLEWGNEVPPGGFLMGQDGGSEGSGPSRHVNIPWSYWLGKYEVRNDQYCDFLNTAHVAGQVYRDGTSAVRANAGRFVGLPGGAALIRIGDTKDIRWNVSAFEVVPARSNCPVRVTWYGALAFAQQYGYDLPTEAEWEKASRGPTNQAAGRHLAYPWGGCIHPGNANYTNSQGGSWNGPVPVGQYASSGYNLHDMSGNIEEWCLTPISSYDTVEYYPRQEYSNSSSRISFSGGGECVYRGGSWADTAPSLMCFSRSYASQPDQDNGGQAGFRVIRRSNGYSSPRRSLAIFESFDAAAMSTDSGGTNGWITSPNTIWLFDSSNVHLKGDAAIAWSGTNCVKLAPYTGEDIPALRLPDSTEKLADVSVWVRAVHSNATGSISLQGLDPYYQRWADTPAWSTITNTSYGRVDLPVDPNAYYHGFRLVGHGVYIDDIMVFRFR